MRNLLGVDFFRVVSEPLINDWSQVYAKIPFEREDVLIRGGIFGVVRLKGKKETDGVGSEILEELEDKYNQSEGGDVLSELFVTVTAKEKEVELVLVEIKIKKEGRREVRIKGRGGMKVEIIRGGQRVCLFEGGGTEEIIKGELESDDRLLLMTEEMGSLINGKEFNLTKGDLGEIVELLSTRVMAEDWDVSMAGLFLECGRLEEEEEEEKEIEEVRVISEEIGKKDENLPPEREKIKLFDWWNKLRVKRRERLVISVEEKKKRGKGSLFVGLLFLALVVVTVGLGYWKTKEEKEKKAFLSVYETLDKKRADALSLSELNPIGAKDLMAEVREGVKQKEDEYRKSNFGEMWQQLEGRVEEGWRMVSGEYEINPEIFFDLGLVRSGFLGQQMAVGGDGEMITILDQVSGVVVNLGYPDKKAEVVMGKGEGANWRDAGFVGDVGVVVKPGEIILGEKGFEVKNKIDNPVALVVFGGGVYVLDKDKDEIWKFGLEKSGEEVKLGEGLRWLKGEAMTKLSSSVDMTIDGDIWIGLENGEVVKLRQGNEENFVLIGTPEEMKLSKLTVGETKIGILDKVSGRLVVFTKEGDFVKQLMWTGFSEANDLGFISADELLVLSGGKLYKVSL